MEKALKPLKIKPLCYLLIASLFPIPNESKADSIGSGITGRTSMLSKEMSGFNSGVSEFYFRSDKDDILVPIYVLGSVLRPGLYHVPVKTDVITVLTLAGGLSELADSEKINVKSAKDSDTKQFSVKELMLQPRQQAALLNGHEVLFVEKDQPLISSNTMLAIGFITSIAGIVLTAIVLRRETR